MQKKTLNVALSPAAPHTLNARHPSGPIDVAVDLGVAPDLPEIVFLRNFEAEAPVAPPQLVDGILHRGCKMLLGGTSKSNKSWCLLDLAISVASGQPWWGRPCAQAKVVYVNFELHRWSIAQRLKALCAARPECTDVYDNLALWNLRGYSADLALLRPRLEAQLAGHAFGLIILDPAYKLLGNRDENANGEIAALLNEVEALIQSTGAAVVLAHHFAKGDSTAKNPIDRMSGAGAWARDPDSLLIVTPHEEPDCFTVSPIVRNLPQVREFVLLWDFPIMRPAADLDPAALRRPQRKNKTCTDRAFIQAVLGETPKEFAAIVQEAQSCLHMSRRTVARYLTRLAKAGLIGQSGGRYWAIQIPTCRPDTGDPGPQLSTGLARCLSTLDSPGTIHDPQSTK